MSGAVKVSKRSPGPRWGIASFTVIHSPTGADQQAPDSSDTMYACITSVPRVTEALIPALRPRERCGA
ncbi:hypothetical protein AB0454_30560 [Streptomyces sp. NPDC093509]|uniref:hypothetical protein n=1 Tax=Streptomyces sp. NPDC093509 TaxID=3154982 RepID=UPI00344B83E0